MTHDPTSPPVAPAILAPTTPTDSRASADLASDPGTAERRASESRMPERRTSESRVLERRPSESRMAERRPSESRMALRPPGDPRLAAGETGEPGAARGEPRPTAKTYAPAALPRGTGEVVPLIGPHRPTGTQRHPTGELAEGPLRTLIYAPEPTRLSWIESELSRAPIKISIQVGRRVRNVVAALLRDPPPRPEVLIVDFDAVSPGELLELHAVRHDGWFGKMIGLGVVPRELCESLGVSEVLSAPLVRDSLLDSVAGTTHAAITRVLPVFPKLDSES